MSSFIWACMASLGLMLMPPESYMIPLPTSASDAALADLRAGRYDSLMRRASSAEPEAVPVT